MTATNLLALKTGECGTVAGVFLPDRTFRRLLDMGCIPGASITALGESPLGGMRAYRICGATVGIRESDAMHIRIFTESR